MYDGIVAHIDPHMAAVTDDIAGLCIGKADPVSAASQSRGAVGETHAEIRIYAHDETGTVCTVGQAGTAVYIRIAHKLACKACHCIGI